MIQWRVGAIVRSLAGRDKGEVFLLAAVTEKTVLLVDGKGRTLRTPKQKNRRHVQLVDEGENRVSRHLRQGDRVTNSEIRKALGEFARPQADKPMKAEEVVKFGEG